MILINILHTYMYTYLYTHNASELMLSRFIALNNILLLLRIDPAPRRLRRRQNLSSNHVLSVEGICK